METQTGKLQDETRRPIGDVITFCTWQKKPGLRMCYSKKENRKFKSNSQIPKNIFLCFICDALKTIPVSFIVIFEISNPNVII